MSRTDYREQKIAFLDELGFSVDTGESWDEIIARLEESCDLTENYVPTQSGKMMHCLWFLDNHYDVIYDLDRCEIIDEEEQDNIESLLNDCNEDAESEVI